MGFYDKVQTAKRTDRLPPLVDGFYPLLQVLSVSEMQGAAENGGGMYYKAELLVLESGPGLSQPGTRATFMEQIAGGKFPELAQAGIAEFVGACLGIAPADTPRRAAEVTPQLVESTTQARQPLAGFCFAAHARAKVTKGKGSVIATYSVVPALGPDGKPIWRPVPEQFKVSATAPTASAPTSAPLGNGGAYGAAPPPFPGASPPPPPAPAAFPPPGVTASPDGKHFWKQGWPNWLPEADARAMIAAGH